MQAALALSQQALHLEKTQDAKLIILLVTALAASWRRQLQAKQAQTARGSATAGQRLPGQDACLRSLGRPLLPAVQAARQEPALVELQQGSALRGGYLQLPQAQGMRQLMASH